MNSGSEQSKKSGRYDSLDAGEIQSTILRLRRRIDERFPGSGLAKVCRRLLGIADQASERSRAMSRPVYWIRTFTILLVVALVVVCLDLPFLLAPHRDKLDFVEFVEVLEPGINILVLIGASLYFLVSLETRYKRSRALKAIHELRAVAHIIDMHQLTKDPDSITNQARKTSASPVRMMNRFELLRYLDYCSEMLSLNGKIAALYIQQFDDSVAIASVNEVETLCTGLTRKIWQKIMILHDHNDDDDHHH